MPQRQFQVGRLDKNQTHFISKYYQMALVRYFNCGYILDYVGAYGFRANSQQQKGAPVTTKAPAAEGDDQIQVYADLVKLYPENEAYTKQYAELLLEDGQLSTATEMLRHLHALLVKKGNARMADALVEQFPQMGRIRSHEKTDEDICNLLPDITRSRLWLRIHQQRIKEGRYLFHQGEMGDLLYLVREGELVVFITDKDGKPVLLNIVGPGDVVGEAAFLNPGPRDADVVANKDSVVVELPRKKMISALINNPDLKATLKRKADVRHMTHLLSSNALLKNIPMNMRQSMAEDSHIQQYASDSTIYKAGEKLNHVDVLVHGKASYMFMDSASNKVLETLRPGDLIGYNPAILESTRCPADIVTISDVTIAHIPCATLKNITEAYPPLRESLLHYAGKNRERLMQELEVLQTR